MPVTPNSQIDAHVFPETMIPGQREPGSLTRFAVTPNVVQTMVDVTMDAAGRADRQREGGGAPSERRPAHASRWAALLERIGVRRGRQSPLTAPVTDGVAVHPRVL